MGHHVGKRGLELSLGEGRALFFGSSHSSLSFLPTHRLNSSASFTPRSPDLHNASTHRAGFLLRGHIGTPVFALHSTWGGDLPPDD